MLDYKSKPTIRVISTEYQKPYIYMLKIFDCIWEKSYIYIFFFKPTILNNLCLA